MPQASAWGASSTRCTQRWASGGSWWRGATRGAFPSPLKARP